MLCHPQTESKIKCCDEDIWMVTLELVGTEERSDEHSGSLGAERAVGHYGAICSPFLYHMARVTGAVGESP